jgi:hypothetical protein
VRDRLTEAMKHLRCGHLMMLMQLGSMPPELVTKSTELFAREVMPHMRGLWSEYQDKWSPKRMPDAEIATPAPLGLGNGAGNGGGRVAAKSSSEARTGK